MTAARIIKDALVPDTHSVFFLGCFETRVTLYAQQVRALNLVDAIISRELVRPEGRVAIVGAGAAGVTAAAAFALAKDRLTIDLFERKDVILHLQARSEDRYLHPHLYDWPAPHALEDNAGLPLLNWRAGPAGDVAAALQKQFSAIKRSGRGSINEKFSSTVESVEPCGRAGCRVTVKDSSREGDVYDVVIISVGFGYERHEETCHSYWGRSPLLGSIRAPGEDHSIFISGNGDGGLVDFQMAAFNGIEHRAIAELLTGCKGLDPVRRMLLKIEKRAWNEPGPIDLFAEYRTHLSDILPKRLILDARDQLRPDAHVWLHTQGEHLFRRDTAILNRFGAYLAIEVDRIFARGRIKHRCAVRLIDPDPLAEYIRLEGEAPFKPVYRFFRFGSEKEANWEPFRPLVERFLGSREAAAPGFRVATPSLSRSARDRFADAARHAPKPAPAEPPVRVTPAEAPAVAADLAPQPAPSAATTFDLGHGHHAVQLFKETVLHEPEVHRLFEASMEASRKRNGRCGLLMLVGPSGAGKSVLMAQAYVRARERALFLGMDSPLGRTYEPAAPPSQPKVTPPPPPDEPDDTAALQGSKEVTTLIPQVEDTPPAVAAVRATPQSEATIAASVWMHWLAGACALASEPEPDTVLSSAEAERRITDLLSRIADRFDPVYLFIDAVNQADSPETLLSGLELDKLPAGIVVVASTHDDEEVIRRLRGGAGEPYRWERLDVAQPKIEETVSILLHDWPRRFRWFPTLDAETRRLLEEKVDSLRINAWGWGQLLRQLMRNMDGPVALQEFRDKLDKAERGAFPDEYLARLVTQVERDFSPAWLPEGLGWCLAMVPVPMGREALHSAQAALRPLFSSEADASPAQVDAALARLSGFLVSEGKGPARRWSLRNESLRSAWMTRFAEEPGLTEEVNLALLPFGATPLVDRWSTSQCYEWVTLTTERAAHFRQLSTEQRGALLQGLLDRIVNGSLPGAERRDQAVRQQQAFLAYEKGDAEASGLLAQEVYKTLQARATEELPPEMRADLLFDLAAATRHVGWFAWHQGRPEHVELADEAVRLFHMAEQAWPERWTPLRAARLIGALRNKALEPGKVGRYEEAVAILDEAVALGATLDPRIVEVRAELTDCHSDRAWYLGRANRRAERIAALGNAVAIYATNPPDAPDHDEQLARLLHDRASELYAAVRYEEAADDFRAAIALYHGLDQARAEVRQLMAAAYGVLGDCGVRLEQTAAAVGDYRQAIAQASTLEQTDERQLELGLLQRRAAKGLRDLKELEQAEAAYAQAIATLEPLSKGNPRASTALQESYHERASALRLQGRGDEALAAYRGLPEVVLLRNNEFGVLFESMGEMPAEHEWAGRLSDLATFLAYEPLPAEHVEWAHARLGMAGDEFTKLRERVAFRIAPLVFYPGAHLLVAEDTSRRGRAELFALCRLGSDDASAIDWTNGPIYGANSRWGIELDDDRQVKDYCRFFFHFVYGRHGPFEIFDDIAELAWQDGATEADFERARALASPLTVVSSTEPNEHRLDSRMMFKGAMFSATISVVKGTAAPAERGLVSLSDEALLTEDLPVHEPPLPYLRDREAPPPPTRGNAGKIPRESPLVRLAGASEQVLLRKAQLGVLLHRLAAEDPAREPLPRIADEARFLSFAPLPEQHVEWVREQLGLVGVEFARVRERVAFRIAPLSFYDDGYLLAAEDTSRRGRREMFALVRPRDEVIGLDWTPEPIYDEANARWELRLDLPHQVLEYCRFLFHFVHGETAPLRILENVLDLPWQSSATDADFARVRSVSSPPSVLSFDDDRVRIAARILRGDSVLSAIIHVSLGREDPAERGIVTLSDEAELLKGVPIRVPVPPFLRDTPAMEREAPGGVIPGVLPPIPPRPPEDTASPDAPAGAPVD